MKFTVLGPLTLSDGGCLRALPTAPKTRSLLALLVLHAGRPVPQDVCREELWPEEMPPTAVQSLHTRVLHVRRALADLPSVGSLRAAKQILATEPGGYALRLGENELDLHDLEHRLRLARQAELARDDRKLSFALRDALGLWRGPVLGDIQAGPLLEAHVTGLEERRVTLLEKCVEAELRLGLHRELLPELRSLTVCFPTHENLHAQYMVALHRSGRVAQCLEVYRRLRDRLVSQLGIEPSSRLRELHAAVLAESPDLAWPGPGPDGRLSPLPGSRLLSAG
ncbi:BTAD domain-containing putative transcriptional regulator [Streptomyces sp. NPDC017936]|uniref:AfsR/SARP family transcriptional regulator n=1 Tax=Streptomyces sp. NPDC017936 TaxID=3365016 RepID=UPI0037A3BEA6